MRISHRAFALASLGCANDSLPYTADISEHCGEFAGDTIDMPKIITITIFSYFSTLSNYTTGWLVFNGKFNTMRLYCAVHNYNLVKHIDIGVKS